MDPYSELLRTTIKLVKLLDKGADTMLPSEIVDVVKLHSKIAVGSAWIPVPGVDAAAGAANIWSMYIRINKKIGLSVGENILKTVGAGVATNLASYAAASGAASLLKATGIGWFAGSAIMSASLYAITLASGYVYLLALTKLASRTGGKINASDISDAVKEVLKEKTIIKDFVNAAKKTK